MKELARRLSQWEKASKEYGLEINLENIAVLKFLINGWKTQSNENTQKSDK
jgi:hypothetical protein